MARKSSEPKPYNGRSISLVPYTLEFADRERGVSDKPLPEGFVLDPLEVLEKFLGRLKRLKFESKRNEALILSKNSLKKLDPFCLHCFLGSGTYGEPTSVISTKTEELNEFDSAHAPLKRFLFFTRFSKGSRKGYVLMERRGKESIKTLFKEQLDACLKEDYDSHFVAKWELFLSPELLESQARDAKPKRIVVTKHIPADPSTNAPASSWEVVYKSRSLEFDWRNVKEIVPFLKKKAGYGSVLVDAFEPDDVQIKVTIGGKPRIIRLDNDGQADFRASYDVTSDCRRDPKTRFRSEQSVIDAASSIVETLPKL